MIPSGERTDLTSYLLGERSELRALIEAISQAEVDDERERAAVEYLLVLASARLAASGEAVESRALAQVRGQYRRVFAKDSSEHGSLLRELYSALSKTREVDVITALKLLGLYHRKLGAYQSARAAFSVATELASKQSDPIDHLNTLFWLGVAERYVGNLDRAEAVHREQLALAREVHSSAQAVLAQENLGLVALRRGQVAEARKRVLRALNEALELEDPEIEGYCYHALMTVETYAGRPGEAAACGWKAYVRYESTEQRLRALQDCAVVLYGCGFYEEAQAGWEIVLNATDDFAVSLRSRVGMMEAAAKLGKRKRFELLVSEILEDDRLANIPFELIETHHCLGLAYGEFGEEAKARHHLIKSLTLAEEGGYEAQALEISDQLQRLVSVGSIEVEPAAVPGDEYERLEDVGSNIKAERSRLCA